jgi:hypothetical protein
MVTLKWIFKKETQSGPRENYYDDCSQQNQISLDIALFVTYGIQKQRHKY